NAANLGGPAVTLIANAATTNRSKRRRSTRGRVVRRRGRRDSNMLGFADDDHQAPARASGTSDPSTGRPAVGSCSARRRSMLNETPVIDADSHIVEPPSMWQQYLPEEFRQLAPSLVVDEGGIERVAIAGQVL